ncbi:MAG: BlaI/MecI/CopY family transcriptional regulator [Acidimicrobiales bacterium]|jgi:predicted transcriptional regulator
MAGLGELERRVMDVLWGSMGIPMTGRQVADQLPDRAYTTILTILERLRRKNLVERTTDEKVHRFAATASRETYMAELMVEAFGSAQDRQAVLVRFAEVVSPEEAVVLRQALADLPDDPSGKRR